MASTRKGLQRQHGGQVLFCDLGELIVNLGKTKVMIFNCWKKSILDFYFYFRGGGG
jgi:hypothetical protein